MTGWDETEEDKLRRRCWVVELSIQKNKYGSMEHILEDAEKIEHWILRDRKAEVILINNKTEKEKL
ncbi:MAG: hypothetical protein ACK502_10770 [Alphaproteobacteria bacterium]